jgi:hypothetical protein
MPQSGTYRVSQALSRRGQLETVSISREEAESGFALHSGNVTTDGRGGNAELGTRRREILMPGGDFEHDQGIEGRQRPSQGLHIEIISNASKISSVQAFILEYKYKKGIEETANRVGSGRKSCRNR